MFRFTATGECSIKKRPHGYCKVKPAVSQSIGQLFRGRLLSKMNHRFPYVYLIINDCVRSTREGYVLTCVCPSVHNWGVPQPGGSQARVPPLPVRTTDGVLDTPRSVCLCVHAGGLSCLRCIFTAFHGIKSALSLWVHVLGAIQICDRPAN